MFPSKKSRGGSGFDNPEPSSPKVTCIGQVRVKTKKQGKKMKMKACRSKRLSGGEASFRRIEHPHEGLMHQNSQAIQTQQPDCGLNHRNQRWVHLPLTICDALRAFGAEFSCLLPCKSSCFSSCGGGEREKSKEREGANSGGSCGAVFRWLVALQEGEVEGKERDIELVVGEETVEREGRESMVMGIECSSRRRSIFDDMDIKDEIFDVKNDGQEHEAARVSICIPPKNALLLMRCRSDPAKMSALSHKIWEAPVAQHSDDDGEEEEDEEEAEKRDVKGGAVLHEMEEKTEEVGGKSEKLGEGGHEIDEMCADWVVADANAEGHEMGAEDLAASAEEKKHKIEENQDEEEIEEKESAENRGIAEQLADFTPEEESQFMEDEDEPNRFSIDAITIRKMFEEGTKEQDWMTNIKEETEIAEISDLSSSSSPSSSSAEESTAESRETQREEEENEKEFVKSMEKQEEEEEKPPLEGQQELIHQRSEAVPGETLQEERENYPKWEEEEERENTKRVLPDCLLLMMCEPKLSMEVSKETWVCSTDFIRWLPERHPSKKATKAGGSDEPKKKKKAPPQQAAPPVQPARSSISFPAGALEQKMAKTGVGYEPFVLTRCKSAPMRSTAKISATELACSLWGRENGRKMEPHRPPPFGVGAAGGRFLTEGVPATRDIGLSEESCWACFL